VNTDERGRVTTIEDIARSHLRINGGFFIFRQAIFDYMRAGEELVNEPFQRLVADDQLLAYEYDGFWQAMDTFKDRQRLEQMCTEANAPWELWKNSDPVSTADPFDAATGAPASYVPRRSQFQL
jgi:glucose-1-phosphate cytidylyltransferase